MSSTISALAERWPRAFFNYERRRRPLKRDIDVDIIATGAIPLPELRTALRLYVTCASYLYSCKEGAVRVDLDGNAAGVVSAREALRASEQLAAIRKFRQQRKTGTFASVSKAALAERSESRSTAKKDLGGDQGQRRGLMITPGLAVWATRG